MDLARAVSLLRAQEVVGMPTDTVYGIGADPQSNPAVDKLFALKGRAPGKPIGLLVADLNQARDMVELPEYAVAWAEAYWPGPLNLVGRPLVEVRVGSFDSLAVRVPDHETALALLQSFGPLAVTSANEAGGPESLSGVEARRILGERVPYYLPGICPGGVASTTVDVRGRDPVILRRGPLNL